MPEQQLRHFRAYGQTAKERRRELSLRVKNVDPEQIRIDRDARMLLEHMENPATAHDAAEQLLGWLKMRSGDHA